ncbi:MAG: serine/threonine protein kinase [Planctomycetota bacterium]|nr:serine/threonine protein kinase [Planctomycetota bacterium]
MPVEGLQLGPYVLRRRLGEGSTGNVWYAFDSVENQPVAIKFLDAQYLNDEAMLALFMEEAKAAAQLQHPHIARALRTGRYDRQPFIVMEYVQGPTLQDLIHTGPLPEGACIWVLRQMAQALRELSRQQIVHQDIKPTNIIVEPDGNCKLVDLGFARRQGGAIDWAGLAAGTALFMSPEQCRGGKGAPVEARSDQYALGATIYYIATGEPPFDGRTDQEIMRLHLEAPLAPAHRRRAQLSQPFSLVLDKMLAKDPAWRFATPEALLMELRRLRTPATPPW